MERWGPQVNGLVAYDSSQARHIVGRRTQRRFAELSLIAIQNQDFQTATDYLNAAYRQDRGHRGVVKHLGYVYVWGRQYEMAQAFLSRIPEARREMQLYTLWWATHERPDLAQNAEEMARRLASGNSIRPVALSSRLVIP
jgi:thioredoxin-like negative regulator of GroEL